MSQCGQQLVWLASSCQSMAWCRSRMDWDRRHGALAGVCPVHTRVYMCASLWLKALCSEWSLLGLRSGLHHLEILTSVILPHWLCVWRQWSNRARPSEVHEREPGLHFFTFASLFLPEFWTGVPPISFSTGPGHYIAVSQWTCGIAAGWPWKLLYRLGHLWRPQGVSFLIPVKSGCELKLFLACCRALLCPAMGSWGKGFAFASYRNKWLWYLFPVQALIPQNVRPVCVTSIIPQILRFLCAH